MTMAIQFGRMTPLDTRQVNRIGKNIERFQCFSIINYLFTNVIPGWYWWCYVF